MVSFAPFRAKLIEVEDGDTVRLLIDNAFGSRQEESIRLLDVYAPEKNQPGGPETKKFVEDWFVTFMYAELKWPLWVQTLPNNRSPEPDQKRTFTRYVGNVYVMIPEWRSVNAAVINFLAQHPEWGKGIGG